jgi:hypothetical protein
MKENNCKIKMSQRKIDFTDDSNTKLIYNEGVLNSMWDESSSNNYISPSDSDIEYFFIVEIKFANDHNHDVIVI